MLREFKVPPVMHAINKKLFCLQLVCSYPLGTLDWHTKMAQGGHYSQATSNQWLQAASERQASTVEVCDVQVRSLIEQDESKLLFSDGFDCDDCLFDDDSKSLWMVPDEHEHMKGALHVALNSSLLECGTDKVKPTLTMRGGVTLMPED